MEEEGAPPPGAGEAPSAADSARERAVEEFRRKVVQHRELDSKVRGLRDEVKKAKGEFDKTEDDLKALQSVGQIIGEVLRQLDEERCEWWWVGGWVVAVEGGWMGGVGLGAGERGRGRGTAPVCGRLATAARPPALPPFPPVIVKSSSGPRYVVGCRTKAGVGGGREGKRARCGARAAAACARPALCSSPPPPPYCARTHACRWTGPS